MTEAEKSSVHEQLEKLESLRASGALTDDEFRNLKSALILKELQANSPRNVAPKAAIEEPPASAKSFSNSLSQNIELPSNNTTRRTVIVAGSLVAAIVVAILIGSQIHSGSQQGDTSAQQQTDTVSSSSSSSADANSHPIPADEAKFIGTVTTARNAYNFAPNDMAKGGTRGDRRTGICQILQDSRSVNGWIGTIKSLSSNGDGKGVLAISIAEDVVVGTWNNALSDIDGDTLMDQASPVFKAASAMKEGDKIQFSGIFIPSDVDCVRESSLTLGGSMQSPAFVMRFASVSVPSIAAPVTPTSSGVTDSNPAQPSASTVLTPSSSSQSQPLAQQPTAGSAAPTDQAVGETTSSPATPSQQIPARAQSMGHWYYCDPAKAYYPYVKLCPTPWRAVTPNSGTTAQAEIGQREATGTPANLGPPPAQSSGEAK